VLEGWGAFVVFYSFMAKVVSIEGTSRVGAGMSCCSSPSEVAWLQGSLCFLGVVFLGLTCPGTFQEA